MSDSDATVMENLRLARDYVLARITAGSDVVSYSIGGRSVTRRSAHEDLTEFENLIERYEARVNAGTVNKGGRNYALFNDWP